MKNILIVEDERKIRELYVKILKSLGVPFGHVFEAENAVIATSIIGDNTIHLMLLDINLPAIDGIMLYDVVKQYSNEMDIIIASVYPVERQKEICPGAKDYYDKSEGPRALLAKLAPLIGNS
jgi:YesN/AraC family two-component response regulator